MASPPLPEVPMYLSASREDSDGGASLSALTDAQILKAYVLEHCQEFRELSEIKQKGWENPAGDGYFEKQRQTADRQATETSNYFYALMVRVATQLQQYTGAMAISAVPETQPMVLDMCMAPGGFLMAALHQNPASRAVAFSLPFEKGGHRVHLSHELLERVQVKFLDITLLAADMGANHIPPQHPEAGLFLPRQFQPDQLFDLAICDGQVLRQHERAAYREPREARRLASIYGPAAPC